MKVVRLTERPLVTAVVVAFALWILLQLIERALWVLVLVLLSVILAAALMPIVLSPLVTGRAVKLSPSLIIASVAIGLALYGAIGALIAIPVAAALQVLTREVFLPWLRAREGVSTQRTAEPRAEHGDRPD